MRGYELLEIVNLAHKNCVNGKILRKIVRLGQWLVIDYNDALDILNNIPSLSKSDAFIILNLYENYKGLFKNYAAIIKEIRTSKNEIANEILDDGDITEIVFMLEIAREFPVLKKDIYSLDILLNSAYFIDNRKELFTLLKHPSIYYKNSIVRIIEDAYYYHGYQYARILASCLVNNGIRKSAPCLQFLLNEYDLKILKLAKSAFLKNRIRKDIQALEELRTLRFARERIDYLHKLLEKYPDNISKSEDIFPSIESQVFDVVKCDGEIKVDNNLEKSIKEDMKINTLTESLAILIDDYVRRDISFNLFIEELSKSEYQDLEVRNSYIPRSLRKIYGYERD